MSRSIDREEETPIASSVLEGLSRSGGEKLVRVQAEAESTKDFGANRREKIVLRDREYLIRPSQRELLETLGTFRVVREEDLVRGIYGEDSKLADADFRSLRQQNLIRSINFQSLGRSGTKVHTLSGSGHDLVTQIAGGLRFYYFASVKPAEVEHDSLHYRAYLREKDRLESSGHSVKRVVLDVDLKKAHFSRVNKVQTKESPRKVQEDSARELHLPVVDGHVTFPDFRVEYEDERGELARVDVEVATENYRGKHLSAKAQAGFQIYGPASMGGVRIHSGGPLKGHAFPQQTRMVLLL